MVLHSVVGGSESQLTQGGLGKREGAASLCLSIFVFLFRLPQYSVQCSAAFSGLPLEVLVL